MENPEIRQAWENFTSDPKYSKYFISNVEVWYNTLASVKTYIDTNKNRPKNNDTNKFKHFALNIG